MANKVTMPNNPYASNDDAMCDSGNKVYDLTACEISREKETQQ